MQQKTYKPIDILGKWVYHTANGNKHPQDQEKRKGTRGEIIDDKVYYLDENNNGIHVRSVAGSSEKAIWI